ncbi:T9SS type A sorting domain-containing protein [Hymenobacter sp. M29]|uniref:T9SS type A sorting domain-containing protein n=1 Tax=Hymenobacter mellowenesis TaxID=3063995 RepID=A0ABT9AEY4_9BACT|nr:T9SS type A sorting domain-containing protein [Hymenobacter sp. M29]MDO7848415.1 T9SS type A sorting domain-containing protein [Hymenobacter sp. M29]
MRYKLLLLVWLLMGLGAVSEVRASHLLGGDLTYVSLGNNQYRVKFRLYRDCSGIVPLPFTLECRNGGCNATATLTAPLVQQGAVEMGNPFCAAVSAGPCQGPAGLPNYDRYTYQATVTLAPGNWALSVGTSQDYRTNMTNMTGNDLYVEATLDNRSQGTTAVANTSPQFDALDIPMQYVCWRQNTTITFPATEPDGDSLAYTLTAPLQACGTPVRYTSVSLPPVLAPVSSPSGPCFFNYPGSGAIYFTPTNPILLGVDTLGRCPSRTGVTRTLFFNPQARTLTFTPGILNANTTPGANQYQLAILVTEYRRIGGVRRVIGTVRREMTVVVADCNGNSLPNPPTVGSNPNLPDTTRIDVRTCSYTRVELSFTDPDNLLTPSANQHLTVTLPPNLNSDPSLFGAPDVGTFRLTGNGSTNPKAVLLFQPSPTAGGRVIRFNLKIEDDACPVKGVQNRVIIIRIFRGNYAQITPILPPPLCQGASMVLQGQILRTDSVRNFTTNTSQLQPYAYQWTANAGGNGLPAVTNTRDIAVNPTVTTRYYLRVTPTLGYTTGCGDTTSVVVRVRPGVTTPVITRNGQTLTSSYATGNQWYLNGQPIPGATGQSITIANGGTYTVQTVVAGPAGSCTSPASAAFTVLSALRAQPGTSLGVAPNPTPDGRLQVTLTGYSQPVALTVFDALGRRVAEASVPAPNPQGTIQELNLSGCEAGLYLLQVRTATSLEVRRIVRQ